MTKKDLMEKLEALLAEKKMYKIETSSGKIGWNDYLTIFKLKYPNSYKTIINNGNWLTHSHNRYYVYCSAKAILA